MDQKARVCEALAHKPLDVVPYQINFSPDAYNKMADYYQNRDFLSDLGNAMRFFDPRPKKTVVKEHYTQDEFGVVFNKTRDKEIGVVEKYLVSGQNIASFAFPDESQTGYFEKYNGYTATGQYNVAQFSHVLFERGWMLYGMENLLADMLLAPQTVHTLLDRILEYFLGLLERVKTYDFIDCCYFGDDWGQQRGLIMGPDMWRKFFKPRLKTLFDAVKAMNKTVYIHTCGDIREIMPDIIELGVDIYDPFQPEVCDIAALKREYGKDITFLGGISLQNVLPFGTRAEVREEVNKRLDMARSGGYIVGPSHAVTKDVPSENMAEMIHLLKNQAAG